MEHWCRLRLSQVENPDRQRPQTSSMRSSSIISHAHITTAVVSFIVERSFRNQPQPPGSTDETWPQVCDVISPDPHSEVAFHPLNPPQLNHHGPRNPSTEVRSDYKQQIHLWASGKCFQTGSESCYRWRLSIVADSKNRIARANSFLTAAPRTYYYIPHRNGHPWQACREIQYLLCRPSWYNLHYNGR